MSQETHNTRPPIAAAVIVHDGKLLLVKRRVREGELSWQFPAGEVERGESAGEAAVREAREETGLTVAEAKVLGERIHPATGRTMVYVACNVTEGRAHVTDPDELVDLVWVQRNALREYVPHPLYPPVQEFLDTAISQ